MPKCSVCDREFKNDLAMKIHFGRQHRRKRRAKLVGKGRSEPVVPAIAPTTVEVPMLSIEQLIELKHQVDARLRHIAKRLRLAKVRA